MTITKNLFSLENKTVVITGALGHLGKSFCNELAKAGSNIVVTDLDEENCIKQSNDLMNKYDVECIGVHCDVTSKISVTKMVSKAINIFEKVDVLINNAVYRSTNINNYFNHFEDYDIKEWNKSIQVNLNGIFLCSQVIGSIMKKQLLGGSIINISSIYGVIGVDDNLYKRSRDLGHIMNTPVGYSVSKGAIIAFTKYLACYWGSHNIRVNTISPGGVEKDQNELFQEDYANKVPIGRMANTDEISSVVVFLSSEASNYVTGQNLIVDGGLTAW